MGRASATWGGQIGVGFSDHWINSVTYDLCRPAGSRLGFETLLCEHGRRGVDRREQPSWLLLDSPANDGPIGKQVTAWAARDGWLSLAALRKSIPRTATVWTMNETSGSGRLELNPDAVDGFGDPIAKITLPLTDWDRRCGEHFADLVSRLGEALGATRISPPMTLNPSAGHPSGATAMAASPDEGVCDADLQVFGLDNLYLVSNSVFPHQGACPPTLTIAALALRLADHLDPTRRGR